MNELNCILESKGYRKEMILEEYIHYSDGQDSLYLLLTELGPIVIHREKRELFDKDKLALYLDTPKNIKGGKEMDDSIREVKYADVFLSLYDFKPTQDKELWKDYRDRDSVLLFHNKSIKGYAYGSNGKTVFNTQDQMACWSPAMEDMEPDLKLLLTSNIKDIQERSPLYNCVLIQEHYASIAERMDRYGYEHIRFNQVLLWFYGNIHYLNCNTPSFTQVSRHQDSLIVYGEKMDCLEDYEEKEYPFNCKYCFTIEDRILKQLIHELSEKYDVDIIDCI